MPGYIKRTVLYVAAAFFILLGLAGLVLPFLQGFLFLAIGLVLLSVASRPFGAWMEQHTRKYPKLHSFVEKVQHRVEKFVGEERPRDEAPSS